jgi:hypothetical protein
MSRYVVFACASIYFHALYLSRQDYNRHRFFVLAASLMLMLPQVVVAACEKYPGKFDVAAKMIKEASVFRLNVMLHVPLGSSFA